MTFVRPDNCTEYSEDEEILPSVETEETQALPEADAGDEAEAVPSEGPFPHSDDCSLYLNLYDVEDDPEAVPYVCPLPIGTGCRLYRCEVEDDADAVPPKIPSTIDDVSCSYLSARAQDIRTFIDRGEQWREFCVRSAHCTEEKCLNLCGLIVEKAIALKLVDTSIHFDFYVEPCAKDAKGHPLYVMRISWMTSILDNLVAEENE